MPRLKKNGSQKEKVKRSPHSRSSKSRSASNFVEPVRELLMLRISREIERRDWTQAQAAEFLGVTQPRISDLTRGLTDNFTIDSLVQLIGLLGMELKIDTNRGGNHESVFAWLDSSGEAIPYFTKVIAVNPQNAQSYRKRGQAYHQRGQYDLAIGDYTRAMELDSGLQYLRINRAQSYVCLGQFSAAFLDCDFLIAQKPDAMTCSWAYITRASAQQAQGNEQGALAEYANAIKAAPESPSVYFHRGIFFESMHNFNAAIKDFSMVLELEPTNVQAKQHLEDICKKRGEHDDDE
ncbi:MAG TPA: tetratricopeptide repeat protein [Candidatus Melainabacteria bacterium]|jgi:tetratricopeptide (TPR) repeat protein|nr:tetratricopeptide repeat protein [Candidatus Melainabacteria bacterium]HIN67493.1 tetratricopeptide repeat protein [Candidatus Obscuribacterales bacterium]